MSDDRKRLALQKAIHTWIKEDAPLTVKMTMTAAAYEKLLDRLVPALAVSEAYADYARRAIKDEPHHAHQ